MSKGNVIENDLLLLIFNGTTIANLADNAATSPLANVYLSLHTADPGDGGVQTSFEANYTSYARLAVARNSSGWTVASGTAVNAALLSFPTATAGSSTVTHFAIGTTLAGTGKIIYSGLLSSSLAITVGVTLQFPAGALFISED